MKNFILLSICGLLAISCTSKHPGYTKLQPFNHEFRSDSSTIFVSDSLSLTKISSKSHNSIILHDNDIKKLGSKSIDINNIISEYQFVPLETSDNVVVGVIDDLLVDGDQLFVIDYLHDMVTSFNKDGKYLCQIGERGNGHGEYVTLDYCTLNRQTKEVCILDWSAKKLLYYDYDGHYKRTKPMYYYFDALAFWGDCLLLLTQNYDNKHVNGIQGCQVVLSDSNMVPKAGILPNRGFPAWTDKSVDFSVRSMASLKAYPDGVAYSDILSPDTIWLFDGEQVHNICSIDFGPNSLFTTSEEYKKMTTEKYYLKVNQIPSYIQNYALSKDFIWIYAPRINNFIINRHGKEYTTGLFVNMSYENKSMIYNYMNFTKSKIPFVWNWQDNEFVYFLEPSEIVEKRKLYKNDKQFKTLYESLPEKERYILENAHDDDNPIMLVVKLKPYQNQTRIEIVGKDSNFNLGEIKSDSHHKFGKEWLIQNIGDANLKIDSVEVSCECLEILYDSVNVVAPNKYFPFRVFVKPENVLGDFYREIRIFGNFEGSPLELTLEGTFVASDYIRE